MRIKRSLLAVFVATLLVASLFGTVTGSRFDVREEDDVVDASLSGGSVAEDAIEIEDWYDLDEVRDDLDGDYVLMNDLDKDTDGYDELVDTDKGWEPIGNDENPFIGTFDGNGYEISVLYINRPDLGYIGLFGYTGEEAVVNNVSLKNISVSGDSYVGGLVGDNEDGQIENASSSGNVSGTSWIGGLVGANRGEIKYSEATGEVNGFGMGTGGLVGLNDDVVETSSARVKVNGSSRVGGIVGYNDYADVFNLYSEGDVNGERSVGGLVGHNWKSTIENSHYNIDEVLINGEHHVTIGGLFDEQYQDWIEDKNLDIDDYNTLEPVGEYYEISDVQGIRDLLGFSDEYENKFRLANDIDLSDEPGLYIPYFAGGFDGQNFTISNLYINKSFVKDVGMFGYLMGRKSYTQAQSTIRNVGILDIYVGGDIRVGGLVGHNDDGNIENSYVTGNVEGVREIGGLIGYNSGSVLSSWASVKVKGNDKTGGLVGHSWAALINNSYATGDVNGEGWRPSRVGGLVGDNSNGPIKKSYATGNVSGNRSVGGLIGGNSWDDSSLLNVYATGDVTGNTNVGGLVGLNKETLGDAAPVKNSYATGKVTGSDNVGGLIGKNEGGEITDSFWDIEKTGQEESDGGTGKLTEDMIIEKTFTDAGWDFEEDWDIIEDETYPFFQWQEEDTYPYPPEPDYKLTINIEEGGSVIVHGREVEDGWTGGYFNGTEVSVEAVPEEGWGFMEWTGDYEGADEEIIITMDENKTITAHFYELEEYKLVIHEPEPFEGGTTDPEPGNYTFYEGEQVAITAIPEEGWTFDGWAGDISEGVEDFGYAFDPNAGDTGESLWFPLDDPEDLNYIGENEAPDFIAGATWVEDTWYGSDFGGGLWTIDEKTGDMEHIGDTGTGGLDGLAYDDSVDTMYGATVDGLYTVDPDTAETEHIGDFDIDNDMISIASDGDGSLYGIEVVGETGSADLYSIDVDDGDATSVGETDLTLNYAQDMAYDKERDTLYLAAYFGDDTSSGLYELCTDTAEPTHVGAFPDGEEIAGFAIPYETYPTIIIEMDEDKEVTAHFVEEEDEELIDRIREIPGFTSLLLLVASIIAVTIYRKKDERT